MPRLSEEGFDGNDAVSSPGAGDSISCLLCTEFGEISHSKVLYCWTSLRASSTI